MNEEIVIVGDVHLGEIDQARDDYFKRHFWGTFDYSLLGQDAIKYAIMGDSFDYPLKPDEIIECTNYRELGPEPFLLPLGEAKNV